MFKYARLHMKIAKKGFSLKLLMTQDRKKFPGKKKSFTINYMIKMHKKDV